MRKSIRLAATPQRQPHSSGAAAACVDGTGPQPSALPLLYHPSISPPALQITGCSSGLGRALAQRLHAQRDADGAPCYTVYTSARNAVSLRDLAAQGLRTVQLDVTNQVCTSTASWAWVGAAWKGYCSRWMAAAPAGRCRPLPARLPACPLLRICILRMGDAEVGG